MTSSERNQILQTYNKSFLDRINRFGKNGAVKTFNDTIKTVAKNKKRDFFQQWKKSVSKRLFLSQVIKKSRGSKAHQLV